MFEGSGGVDGKGGGEAGEGGVGGSAGRKSAGMDAAWREAVRRAVAVTMMGKTLATAAAVKHTVRRPRVVVGLPIHPAVEDDARAREVSHHLFHVHVLEPELLDARHQRDRAVPNVPRRVDVPVPHLHFGIPGEKREERVGLLVGWGVV